MKKKIYDVIKNSFKESINLKSKILKSNLINQIEISNINISMTISN